MHAPTPSSLYVPFYVYAFKTSYPLLALTLDPHRKKTHGIGNNAKLTNPSRLVAHAIPKPSYIWNVNNGNAAPAA